MRRNHLIAAALALPLAGLLALAPLATAHAQPEQRRPQGGPDFGKALIEGLKASEGCLGAEAAQFQSGKIAIIAWFKDVESTKKWYYSDAHARFMNMTGADPEGRQPLRHVENPDTPVMVVAAITMGGEKTIPGPMPISQISIEMYTPLPGGAAINGRLAPEAFNIPHFRAINPEAQD